MTIEKANNWNKLISGDTEQELRKVILKISDFLENNSISDESLFIGNAGISVFYADLFRYSNHQIYLDLCQKSISDSINSISIENFNSSFCNGYSGILWAFNWLVNNKYVSTDSLDLFEDLENAISEVSLKELIINDHDFLHGGMGVVLTLLENPFNSKTLVLEKVVEIMTNNAEKGSFGYRWSRNLILDTPLKNRETEYEYNLGMAHGTPGLIMIFSLLLQNGISPEKTFNLIENSIKWLYYNKHKEPVLSIFPAFASKLGANKQDSRLAWCYGDLSIALTMINAGKIAQKPEWINDGIDIGLKTVKRKDLEENKIYDVSVCHGFAGVAHIYNRLYQASNVNEFKNESIYWYELLLEKYKAEGFGALSSYSPGETKKIDNGILSGIAGVGLCLISALSDYDSGWDRCILLS